MNVQPEASPHIAIIGGGISGLAAANRMCELSGRSGVPVRTTLLESSSRLGGVIRTRSYGDFVLEDGPDCFITQRPWGLDLCGRMGLNEKLISTNQDNRRVYVAFDGKLTQLPEGFFMMAPTSWLSILNTPLFSVKGKLRMALDMVLPAKTEDGDESLANFVTRRLGREVLDRVAQPLVGGIYSADPERLSLQATMPRFLEMERKYGSVIRGLRAERKARRSGSQSGARYEMFVSFNEGMQVLVDRLASKLPEGSLRLGAPVSSVSRSDADRGWMVKLVSGERLEVNGVIVATPVQQAAALLADVDASLTGELSSIACTSSAVLNLIYSRDDIGHPLDGFGFVVPACEQRSIVACTFSSIKFPKRSPEGKIILRVFLGGAAQDEVLAQTDGDIEKIAREDLRQYLGITAKPLSSSLHRYEKSMPQYEVGHLTRVERIEQRLRDLPGLALAGNAYRGVGIPDCIHSGESAAESAFGCLGRSA